MLPVMSKSVGTHTKGELLDRGQRPISYPHGDNDRRSRGQRMLRWHSIPSIYRAWDIRYGEVGNLLLVHVSAQRLIGSTV
jgi:hypothetical protein